MPSWNHRSRGAGRFLAVSLVILCLSLVGYHGAAEDRGAEECSGFCSAGKATADGSTIVAKIQDGDAHHIHRVVVASPVNGLKYIALTHAQPGRDNQKAGGINEKGVSIAGFTRRSTDVSTRGLSESEIYEVILEKSTDAKSAVYLIKKIVEEQGRRGGTGGGGLIVADANEYWLVETTGHKWGAWGPVQDGVDSWTNFYVLPELRPYESKAGGVKRQQRALSLLQGAEGEMTLPLMMRFTRDQQVPPDQAYSHEVGGVLCNEGYKSRSISGQINIGAKSNPAFLSVVWYALGSPIAAPYIPFYLGITEVPEEYATTTAAAAFAQLHRLLYENPQYRGLVRRVWENFEFQEISEALPTEEKVSLLLRNGQEKEAHALLNDFTRSNCDKALRTARQLIEKITKETDWTAVRKGEGHDLPK
jgi:dipeptidase